MSSRTLATLERIKDVAGHYLGNEAGLLSSDPQGASGTLFGFQYRVTNQIPNSLGSGSDESFVVFSSDWQELWDGENESLTLELSTEAAYTTDGGTTWNSAFQQNQSLFRAITIVDVAPRRPELFVVGTGVKA
jgi:HK97 family phage major capsid protein